jgi:hypothetical protein
VKTPSSDSIVLQPPPSAMSGNQGNPGDCMRDVGDYLSSGHYFRMTSR